MKYIFISLLILSFCGCPRQKFAEVDCSECKGVGTVVYDENHPVVQLGFDEGTYACPICGGQGKLNEKVR